MLRTDSSILKHTRRIALTFLDTSTALSLLRPTAVRSCPKGQPSVQREHRSRGEMAAPNSSTCPVLPWALGGAAVLLWSLETGRNRTQPGDYRGRGTAPDPFFLPAHHTPARHSVPTASPSFPRLFLQAQLTAENCKTQESETLDKQLCSTYMHNNHVSPHTRYGALNQQSNYHSELGLLVFYSTL